MTSFLAHPQMLKDIYLQAVSVLHHEVIKYQHLHILLSVKSNRINTILLFVFSRHKVIVRSKTHLKSVLTITYKEINNKKKTNTFERKSWLDYTLF